MKVHCFANDWPALADKRISYGVFNLYAAHFGEVAGEWSATCAFSLCGKASWRRGAGAFVDGGCIVEPVPFVALPRAAQCQNCRKYLSPGALRDRDGNTIRQWCATPEQITAVECGLIGMSRVWPA